MKLGLRFPIRLLSVFVVMKPCINTDITYTTENLYNGIINTLLLEKKTSPQLSFKRVSMGLTVGRKTAKNLVVKRKS